MEFTVLENPILEFLPDTVEAIRKQYNLHEGRMKQSTDILEQWIQKQNHFLNKNFSKKYLEITIICSKGSVEIAKSHIDKLCTLKTLLPKYFISNNIREKFNRMKRHGYVVPLPKMTKKYQRVVVHKFNDIEISSAVLLNYFSLNIVIAEYLKAHDYIDGMIVVLEFIDANLLDMITKINFVELQQYHTILMEGFGARLQGIHIITKSKVIDIYVKFLKSVLSEKLAQRIYNHQEIEDIHRIIDKDILPIDLGGKERSLKELQDAWIDVLSSEEHENYLKQTTASATDESLRNKDKFNDQYMGLPGSFRTLTVD